ncbi:MAG: AI-2E family transporter [Candidatus Nanopelagicales bacterium]
MTDASPPTAPDDAASADRTSGGPVDVDGLAAPAALAAGPRGTAAVTGPAAGERVGDHDMRLLPEPDAQVPYTLRVLAGYSWRFVAVMAALYVLAQIAGTLTFVLMAVFLGAVFTALVLPLVDQLNRVLPRGLAVVAGLVIAVALVITVLAFIIVAFLNNLPELSAQVGNGVNSVQDWLRNGPWKIDSSQINNAFTTAQQWLKDNAGNLATTALGGLGTFGELLTGFALAMFSAIFFLYDGRGIWSWIVGTAPVRAQVRVRTSGDVAWRTFSAYARGTVIVALSDAILVGIGLSILRVPLSIPLALLVFFGAFIPYVGAPVAMLVAALIALAANGPWSFVAVIVLITIVGQIEGNVLQPLIMSKQVSLHPLVVILSVTMGSVVAGIIGAIVAVPVVAVIWVIIRYLTGRDPDNPREPPFSGERVAGDAHP